MAIRGTFRFNEASGEVEQVKQPVCPGCGCRRGEPRGCGDCLCHPAVRQERERPVLHTGLYL